MWFLLFGREFRPKSSRNISERIFPKNVMLSCNTDHKDCKPFSTFNSTPFTWSRMLNLILLAEQFLRSNFFSISSRTQYLASFCSKDSFNTFILLVFMSNIKSMGIFVWACSWNGQWSKSLQYIHNQLISSAPLQYFGKGETTSNMTFFY